MELILFFVETILSSAVTYVLYEVLRRHSSIEIVLHTEQYGAAIFAVVITTLLTNLLIRRFVFTSSTLSFTGRVVTSISTTTLWMTAPAIAVQWIVSEGQVIPRALYSYILGNSLFVPLVLCIVLDGLNKPNQISKAERHSKLYVSEGELAFVLLVATATSIGYAYTASSMGDTFAQGLVVLCLVVTTCLTYGTIYEWNSKRYRGGPRGGYFVVLLQCLTIAFCIPGIEGILVLPDPVQWIGTFYAVLIFPLWLVPKGGKILVGQVFRY